MRKTFRILILLIFSIISCSKETTISDKNNDISNNGLKGKVKSSKSQLFNLITEKDTFKIGEKINGISFDRNSQMEFDLLGKLTSSKEFLANGELSLEIKYTYDKNHRLIKRQEIDHYGKGSFYDYDFTYNTSDSIIKGVISNGNFKRIHKMERDEKSQLIKKEIIQNDSILGTYTFIYDQNCNVIIKNEYRKKDIPLELTKRTFDKNNLKQKEEIIEYQTSDTIMYNNLFFYNKNNELVKSEMHITNDSVFIEIKNKYYKNGELKETQSVPKGSSYFMVTKQKFNENGNVIEYSRKSNDEKTNDIWTFIYKYDSEKNWIEKLQFKNDEPLRIVKRTIEYY